MPEPVALSQVRLDGGTQIRAELNQFVVDDYAAAMAGGATFPPVVVFYDGSAYWLADGFHRYHATKQAGFEYVAADVRAGTRRDAVLFAVGANSAHGLPRTNADKRRAVEVLLRDPEWAAWSDNRIAEAANVDHKTVTRLRGILGIPKIAERKAERGGTTYTVNTANIGRRPALPPPDLDPEEDEPDFTEEEPEAPDAFAAATSALREKLAEPLPAPKPSPSQRLAPEVRQAIRDTPIAEKPEEVERLARLPEEKQAIVIAKVIEGEASGVKEALAAVKQEAKQALADELRAAPLPAPAGPYRVIVIDPPWRYDSRAEDASHRGRNQYPDMSQAELLALPVSALAEPDAILWLWTTNAFMRDALELVSAWGFTEKTILTWDKVNLGLGDWLRNVTEHCILAVRGRPLVTLTNQTTLITEKRREHSRKPEAFYALVEALCPGSKLEMFSREPREGWAAWGAEVEKFGGES